MVRSRRLRECGKAQNTRSAYRRNEACATRVAHRACKEKEKVAHEDLIGCFSRNGGVDACATCMCHMPNSGYHSGQVAHWIRRVWSGTYQTTEVSDRTEKQPANRARFCRAR